MENLEVVRKKKEMYVAAMKGKVEFLEAQSFSDEYLHLKTSENNNIIHIAIQYEQYKFIEAILEKFSHEKELICEENSKGDTPLHVAAEIGHYDIVSLLYGYLEKNFEGHGSAAQKPWMVQNMEGNTAVHVAIMHDNVKIAKFLLVKDVDFAGVVNKLKEAPLHLAIKQHVNYSETDTIVERIRQPIDKGGAALAIDIAAEEKMPDMIKLLVEKASYVASWPDTKGLTPLHRAASLSSPYNVQIIRFIIEHWPQSAEVRDNSGKSILHHLVNKIPNYKEVKLVLNRQEIYTLRNRQDQNGNTPLHMAAKTRDINMVRALLESSTKLNNNNSEGLCAASVLQQQNVIQILRQRKMTKEESENAERANITYLKERMEVDFLLSQDSKGKNILHKLMHIKDGSHIVRDKYFEFIKEVLEIFTALLSQTDHDGNTPVHILVQNSDINIHIDSQNHNNNKQITSDLDSNINNNFQSSSLWKSDLLPDLLDICCECINNGQKKESDEAHNIKANKVWLVQNSHGNTPLHEAVIGNNKILVLKLLEQDKESARIVNKNKETPLHLLAGAISQGNKEEFQTDDVKIIVAAYKKAARLPDKDGLTPILRAGKVGNLRIAQILCTLSPEAATIGDAEGKTICHLFLKHPSSYYMFRFLKIMDLRKVLEQPDNEGNTPLHQAFVENRFDIVDSFLETLGSKPKSSKAEGETKDKRHGRGHGRVCEFLKNKSRWLMDLLPGGHETPKDRGCENDKGPESSKDDDRQNQKLPKENCQWLMNLLRIRKNKTGEPGSKEKKHEGRESPKDNSKWLIDLLKIPNKAGKTPGDLLAASECLPTNIQKKINNEYAMVGFRSVWGIPTTQTKTYVNTMGVIAALLATITFTTAFTVPGGLFEDIGTPIMIRKVAFHVFMISDVIAMCLSMMVLVILLKIMATSNKRKSVKTMDFCITLLLISLCVTLVTFMTGFFAAMYSVRRWMAIVTIVLCSLLILLVLQFLFSKLRLPFRKYKFRNILPSFSQTKPKKEVDNQGANHQRPEDKV